MVRFRLLNRSEVLIKLHPMNASLNISHSAARSRRVTLYPNLVTQRCCWLQLYHVENGPVHIELYTLSGGLVLKNFCYHAGFQSTHTITFPAHIKRSIYKITIRCADHAITQPIIIL